MQFETLLVNIENRVCIITLNRPQQLNALNRTVFSELESAFDQLAVNSNVRCIIITGSGEKAFAAGADIKEFSAFDKVQAEALSANGQRIFSKIENFHIPVIAAVNGFALGGGCELAMSCHIRIASDNSRFGQPEISLGLIPGYAGTQRLPRLLGRSRATELLLTGDMIKANDALAYGLVSHVVPQAELLTKAHEMAQKIANQSTTAAAAILQCVNAYYEKHTDGFAFEVETFGKCFGTPDFIEGTTAFLEKRKPNF